MDNNKLGFLDVITIISFVVGLQNLEMNITQEDMQESTERLDKALRDRVDDIHKHLAEQDAKINNILNILKENGGVLYDG